MPIDSGKRPASRVHPPQEYSFTPALKSQNSPLPGEDAHGMTGRGVDAGSPLVSVVIPTRNRPLLLERALKSALGQSLRELEVFVVVDGLDLETQEMLSRVNDDRLRILCIDENVGGSEARNIGVRRSRGKWVAFLDDDDEWFPEKLANQWKAGESAAGPYVVVASRFIERTESAERVLPGRLRAAGENFSEYMFARRGWNSGEGFLQTSTWFVSRALMTRVPFTRGLKRCQDLDWLLRATALPETEVVVVPEVLAIFHHDEHGQRVSRSADWRFLYDWAALNRRYFTRRAFSFFIATFCVPSAAKQSEGFRTFLFLLGRCILGGRSSLKCLALFLTCWFVPEKRRRALRASLDAVRPTANAPSSAVLRQPVPSKAS
jgi:glycosyltransferase involved in cell wall biosynthesis